jgi:hypothetical protein
MSTLPGCQFRLAQPSDSHLTTLYDDGHCPVTIGTGKWPAVVSFRWLQRDTLAAAQADYS